MLAWCSVGLAYVLEMGIEDDEMGVWRRGGTVVVCGLG